MTNSNKCLSFDTLVRVFSVVGKVFEKMLIKMIREGTTRVICGFIVLSTFFFTPLLLICDKSSVENSLFPLFVNTLSILKYSIRFPWRQCFLRENMFNGARLTS